MTSGLAVCLSTAQRYMRVTQQVESLDFRSVAPGGFASASISLHRPLNLTPAELAYYGRLFIYAPNGNVVWEGRVEDLGRGSDAGGQVWSVNAVGPMAHAKDTTIPLVYQDVDLGSWQQAPDSPPWMNTQQINTTGFGPGIQMTVPRDTVVPVGFYPGWMHHAVGDAGQNVAVVVFHYGEDVTDSNWKWELLLGVDDGDITGSVLRFHQFTAGSSAGAQIVVTTDFTVGNKYPYLRLERGNSTVTVANDGTTASFTNIIVRSTMFNRFGGEIVDPAFYALTLNASYVVADLLGRLLPKFDATSAVIDNVTADYVFPAQLAYPNGTTADQVLGDLMTVMPSYYWAAWESTGAGYRFEWKPWPTSIRYDATPLDGFASPGSAADLYDSVSVRWLDPTGRQRSTLRTLPNATLTAAALSRRAQVDLGSAVTGAGAAQQAGDQFLQQNAAPPNAGTLTVARPIFDRQLGHTVMPWDIKPGYLIRVKGVAPTVAADSTRDGISTFRIVSVSYSDSAHAAVLELDSPSPSFTNTIAALSASQSYQTRN